MLMRGSWIGVMSVMLVACGVFGESDAPETPLPPPSTPDDNATPPGVGGPPPPGLYVSSSRGNDEGSGAPENPVKTLKKAFALAKVRGLRVIACAETYDESLVLVDGVSAYGYYDCKKSPWERGAPRARIVAPTSPAVVANGLSLPTRLEGFDVIAPDLDGAPATDDAGTSVALEVRGTRGLAVSESLLHGGKGAPGTDGAEGPANARTAASNGAPARDQTVSSCNPVIQNCDNLAVVGPAGGVTTCAIAPSGGAGGKGGDGRWLHSTIPATRAAEFRGLQLVANATTAVGGLNLSASGCGKGQDGAKGAHGAGGADGTNGVWLLTASGFARGNGTPGEIGQPGQGGGGGAGAACSFLPNGDIGSDNPPPTYFETATGGGGGGGGCGGQPGTPATGGGASIGALLLTSTVTFERTRIESSDGGRAGKGNLGTPGIVGGDGGARTVHGVPTTGRGGDGGFGGNAGASGHGAPGPSIAIAYTEKPAMTEVDLAPGPAGAGQPDLKRITPLGTQRLAAAVGESKAEHVITQ